MFDPKAIGQRISWYRKEKNLTQAELAEELNISFQAVSSWERGETMPDMAKLPELARIFGTSIDQLFEPGEPQRVRKEEPAQEPQEEPRSPLFSFLRQQKPQQEFPSILPSEMRAAAEVAQSTPETKSEPEDRDDAARRLKHTLPYLDKAAVQQVIQKELEIGTPPEAILKAALPFLPKSMADQLVQASMKDGVIPPDFPLKKLLPFVSKGVADELVTDLATKEAPVDMLFAAAPFVSKHVADELASAYLKAGLVTAEFPLKKVLPYVSKHIASAVVEAAVQAGMPLERQLQALPFVDQVTASRIAMAQYSATQ